MQMYKKKIGSKRTFIPQSVGDTVKKINKNFTSKFGRLEFVIHSNWSKIVGSYFNEFSEPKQITRFPDFENDLGETVYKNYLNVSVSPGASLEFQHFKNTIIDKINNYFGYKAVLDLRIQQNYIPKNKTRDIIINHNFDMSEEDKKNIKKEVKNMENSELKKSLIDLGININKESK